MKRMLRCALISLAACGGGQPYGGANCDSIVVPIAASALPITSLSPARENVFRVSDPLIAATDPLKCCNSTTLWSGPVSDPSVCASVDCQALAASLMMGPLGGPFDGELCGNGGGNVCRVLVQNGVVVGVSSFCFD